MSSAPSNLFPLVYSFLVSSGLTASASQFKKETQCSSKISTEEDLVAIYDAYKSQSGKRKRSLSPEAKGSKKIKESQPAKKIPEKASDSDSDDEAPAPSSKGKAVVAKPAVKAKPAAKATPAPPPDSDSDTEAPAPTSKAKAPASKPKPPAKGKPAPPSESDSDSDKTPPPSQTKVASKPKPAATKGKPAPQSESESDSDDETPAPSQTKAKAKAPASKDPSKEKPTTAKGKLAPQSESESDSDDKKPAPSQAPKATPANKPKESSEVTANNSAKGKKDKTPNAPFRRVKAEDVVYDAPDLQSNAYSDLTAMGHTFGDKANDILSVVKGKAFRTNKNKLKKKSYRGSIDVDAQHSFKFTYSDDEES